MKKALNIFFCFAFSMLGLRAWGSAADGIEYYRVTPAECRAAVGDTIEFSFDYKAKDGFTLYSWFVPMERRSAPKGFFEGTKREIHKFPTDNGYDHIRLVTRRIDFRT